MHTVLVALALAAAMENPLTQAVANRYLEAKRNLIDSADLMPADQYDFRLSPKDRSFGEAIRDSVVSLHDLCAGIDGSAPGDISAFKRMQEKRDLTNALKDVFKGCDAALRDMNDDKALTRLPSGGYPVQQLVGLIAALSGQYGSLTGYLQAKGITPPAKSRRILRIPEHGGKVPKPGPPSRTERR